MQKHNNNHLEPITVLQVFFIFKTLFLKFKSINMFIIRVKG